MGTLQRWLLKAIWWVDLQVYKLANPQDWQSEVKERKAARLAEERAVRDFQQLQEKA